MKDLVSEILIKWLPTLLECSTVIATAAAILGKFKPITKIDKISQLLTELIRKNEKQAEHIQLLEEEIHKIQLEKKGVKNEHKN